MKRWIQILIGVGVGVLLTATIAFAAGAGRVASSGTDQVWAQMHDASGMAAMMERMPPQVSARCLEMHQDMDQWMREGMTAGMSPQMGAGGQMGVGGGVMDGGMMGVSMPATATDHLNTTGHHGPPT